MKLIKKTNGNIELNDGTNAVWVIVSKVTKIEPIAAVDHVKFFQQDGRVEYLKRSELNETQVEPAAAVPFSGTLSDLVALLSTDFF